ncbi:flagellar biosynthetic protein FliR [Aquabacter cavernae]|uniref:flagellar biosynthetic protein FliR n=1 Tax=Aquabacter cavernae TaxID=2496029 RepID=UPI000F8DCC89|nr:flagellar biosynthetic protein FliR [Aquabacter cavernae]
MNAELQVWIINAILVFSRIGACLMLLPGISGNRLPMQVRLFLGVSLSLALLPVVEPALARQGPPSTLADLFLAISSELAAGAFIGLLARIFFIAFQTLLSAAAQLIGFSSMVGSVVDDGQQLPEIATLLSLVGVILIFVSGLHWQLLRGLVESYSQVPPGLWLGSGRMLTSLTDQMSATFILALRITSPFFIYGVIVNFAIGLTNKLVPQIPVYFISTPFVLAGGLILLYAMVTEMLEAFLDAFALWARNM